MLDIQSFYQPTSVAEAVAMLGPGAAPVAGGTDFCVNPRFRTDIHTVIDVRRCGLSWIRRDDGHLSIGAATTMCEAATADLVRQLAGGIIGHAAITCGSPNVRNVATLGGNVTSSLPSADVSATLLALNAVAVVEGRGGRREIPLDGFFKGPGANALRQELLLELRVPLAPRRGAFQKLGRAADDISVVNSAVSLELADGHMRQVRIVAGAVAPVPCRCRAAEHALEGQAPGEEVFRQAAHLAMSEISPISDQRASADYRRRVAGVLVRRALEDACSLS